MDVQAAAATLPYPSQATLTAPGVVTPPASAPSTPAPAVPVAAAVPAPPKSDAQSSSSGDSSSSGPSIGATPGLATLPASAAPGEPKLPSDPSLSANVAKLFDAQGSNVSVSFEIEKDPNEIVTVFTDKQTGKVIVQFPSETLVALAQFFDKLDGSVVNKKV
jgi:hypothetical protein